MINKKVISKKNLLYNVMQLQNYGKKICAVVKANAYGHGSEKIVDFLKNKIGLFAVANADEAIFLRQKFNHIKLLILGKTTNFECAIKNHIEITIDKLSELKQIESIAKKIGSTVCVHIKVNTGMNRLGTRSLCYFKKLIDYISASNFLVLSGVFTHFFDTENANIFATQLAFFKKFVDRIPKNLSPTIHIGGSGVLNYELPSWVDVVRVGLWLYGYGNKNLKPVLKICSFVSETKTVFAGEYVGYSSAYRAKKMMKIATVGIGYADGFVRALSKCGYVYILGKKCKIVGNICMDMLMCDITHLKKPIPPNCPVVVFKNANSVATLTKLSQYEILTNFNNLR